MKKCLIYNFSGELDDLSHLFPNERLGRIAAVIRRAGHHAEIIDRANFLDLAEFGPLYMKNLGELGFHDVNEPYLAGLEKEAKAILAGGYDLIFLNLWHGTGFKFSVDLARRLKQAVPSLPVYGIGQKVDWYKEHILQLTGKGLDGLITGLGYHAVQELVDNRPLCECPDTIRLEQGQFIQNPREVLNVDHYPAADYDPAVYRQISAKIPLHTITVSNQACPNHCVFCIRPENYGHTMVRRDPAAVLQEMLALYVSPRAVRHFRVEDSTPPALALTELSRRIMASPLNGQIKLSGFARIDTSAGEDFQQLRAAGFLALFFGLETLDDGQLHRVRKGITFEAMQKTLRAAHEAGIATVGSFIFPLPGETDASMKQTLSRLEQLRPWLDSLLVAPAAVYLPTEWGRHPAQFGITLDPDYAEKFVTYPLKYLIPLKYWAPVPYRYGITWHGRETDDFAAILEMYDEFNEFARRKLQLPPLPDYYYLLAALLGEAPGQLTRQLVQAMIDRNYPALAQRFCPV